MGITDIEETKLIRLAVSMFEAAPGKDNLELIKNLYEDFGNNFDMLVSKLSTNELFSSQFKNLNTDLISEKIISNFGMTRGTLEGNTAFSYVVHELNSGKRESEIIKNALDYFDSENVDDMFAEVRKELSHKTEIAEYYSKGLEQSSSSFEELQAVISTVDKTEESVVLAKYDLSLAIELEGIDWYKPTPDTSWQIQLEGEINTSYDVELYDVDLFDSSESLIEALHNEGKKVIAYFSAGSYENWREDKSSFSPDIIGNNLADWDGESWLDIRSEELKDIIRQRLDLAVEKGFDGVDPDNIDGYTNNSGFNLTAEDQLEFNKFLAYESHIRGLSIGLKNDINQIEELEPYFDFILNEQAHYYNECDTLEPFIDSQKAVFNIEYELTYPLCPDLDDDINTLILPLALDDSFRYDFLI